MDAFQLCIGCFLGLHIGLRLGWMRQLKLLMKQFF